MNCLIKDLVKIPEKKGYPYNHIQPTCDCKECLKVDSHNQILEQIGNISVEIKLPDSMTIGKVMRRLFSPEEFPDSEIKFIADAIAQHLADHIKEIVLETK